MIQPAILICSVALSCLTGPISCLLLDNSFHAVTDCSCLNDVVTYQCTVCGLATVWEGTALDSCSGREIALTRRDFIDPRETIVCNGGTISARGISEEDGCFTSRLNIIFNVILQDRTVSCSVDNGTHASQVGRAVLSTLSTVPYTPPESIWLAEVSSDELLFFWNQTQNCPSLQYNILSSNCGNCPNTTNGTSVNCSDFTTSTSIIICMLMVQPVICGNSGTPLIGSMSDSIFVNLTVPTINQVTIIPHYHIDNGLRGLTVTFSTLRPFKISERIGGYAIYYTINYSDSNTGDICYSNEVNSTSCVGGVCSDAFDISSSLCRQSSDINVTVFPTLNLGKGPETNSIKEEYRNNLVTVQIISESASINCTFLNVVKGNPKSCNASITYGENCQDQTLINGMMDSDNVEIVSLRSFLVETASSKYCDFKVYATDSIRTVTVEGNLLTILSPTNNPGNGLSHTITVVVVVPFSIVTVTILMIFGFIIYHKGRQMSANISDVPLQSEDVPKLKIIPVPRACNMIDFAKENIGNNYDPDSGQGYYQFTSDREEYISPKTQVVLVSGDEKQTCTDSKAREMIGVSDIRKLWTLPDLSGTQWKYVFIQSTSRIKILLKGTHFMFYGEWNDKDKDKKHEITTFTVDANDLKLVEKKYYKLKNVPGPEECAILDFAKNIEGVTYNPGLGYGFYEFTKPEYILYTKQVIVMDQDEKLHYGPGARCVIGIGPGQCYDEGEKIEPKFDREKWKHVFIQTRSNVRKLQPDTMFLYCDVASSEMIRVLEPFEVFTVPEADNDERQLIKFAKKNVPYYNPRAFYAYYEFIGYKYVVPDRNIMALNKKNELFTGLGVHKLAGISESHDETKEIKAPDLSNTEWDCIFIQGRKAYGRVLEPKTRFLYCEYDYNPEIY